MNGFEKMLDKLSKQAKFHCCEGGGYEAAAQQQYDIECLVTPNPDGKVYLCNAFSLQMVDAFAFITKMPACAEEIPANAISCIGHADTAAVISNIIGRAVEFNRTSVHLTPGDVAYVFQIEGGRLPEGACTLPNGYALSLYKVIVR